MKKNIHKNPDFDAKDKIRYYVKLMSLKRKAFCYENEIRIFVVLKRGVKKFEEDEILKIEFKNISSLPKLVNKITLDPHFSELEKIPAAYDLNLLQHGSKLNYEKKSKNLLNRSHLKIRLENSQLLRCNKCKEITFPKKLRSH